MDDNKKLKERIKKLETEKIQTEKDRENLETKKVKNVSQCNLHPKRLKNERLCGKKMKRLDDDGLPLSDLFRQVSGVITPKSNVIFDLLMDSVMYIEPKGVKIRTDVDACVSDDVVNSRVAILSPTPIQDEPGMVDLDKMFFCFESEFRELFDKGNLVGLEFFSDTGLDVGYNYVYLIDLADKTFTVRYTYPAVIFDRKRDYWARFPDLPGCYGVGYSIDEAVVSAQKSLGLYLEAVFEDGGVVNPASDIDSIVVSEGAFIRMIICRGEVIGVMAKS